MKSEHPPLKNTWVCNLWYWWCCVAISHKSCFSGKLTINFDIKYHVHIDVLISRPNFYFPHIVGCNAVKFLKLYTYVCHLLCNLLGPKVSPILYVNLIWLFSCLVGLYPKVMWCAPIIGFTLEIILSRWRKVSLTHHLKAGSSLIFFTMAYSDSSTGFDCLRSFSGTQ